MQRFALLLLALAAGALPSAQAQYAAVDTQLMSADREFLKSQAAAASPIPGLDQPGPQTAPPPVAQAPVAPDPALRSKTPPVERKKPVEVAKEKPAPVTRSKPAAIAEETKVRRVVSTPAPVVKVAPEPVLRERVRTSYSVARTEPVRPVGGFHEPNSVDRRDLDEEEVDVQEAADDGSSHRPIHRFFHRLFRGD